MGYIKPGESITVKTELNDPLPKKSDTNIYWMPRWRHKDWCADPTCPEYGGPKDAA